MACADLRIGRFSEPGRAYLVTTVVAGRRPIFTDLYQARAFIRALRATQEARLGTWLAWVLMPDHFHGLVSLSGEGDLATLMRELKGASARELNQRLGRRGRLWQPSFYDHALRLEEDRVAAARYIVANPLRAGLVRHCGDYPHWDSVWL